MAFMFVYIGLDKEEQIPIFTRPNEYSVNLNLSKMTPLFISKLQRMGYVSLSIIYSETHIVEGHHTSKIKWGFFKFEYSFVVLDTQSKGSSIFTTYTL